MRALDRGLGRWAVIGAWTARASRTLSAFGSAARRETPRDRRIRRLFFFLARKWHIAARWGRRRDRRRRTACSPEDASGKAPRAFDEKRRTGAHLGSGRRVRGCGARTARAREHVPSEEATDRYTDRKYAKNHSLALQSWQSQDLSPVDSGLFASLPAPHDRVTRASRAEGPHTRSTSRGPRRRALDARRIAVRLASRTVKNLWSRAAASRRRRATPASERDAPRELPHRRPAVSPRARRCATPRGARVASGELPEGGRARRRSIAVEEGAARVRVRRSAVRAGAAGSGPTPGAEPPRTRSRTSGSGSRALSLWTRGWTARERDGQPRGVAVEAVDVHSDDARRAARAAALPADASGPSFELFGDDSPPLAGDAVRGKRADAGEARLGRTRGPVRDAPRRIRRVVPQRRRLLHCRARAVAAADVASLPVGAVPGGGEAQVRQVQEARPRREGGRVDANDGDGGGHIPGAAEGANLLMTGDWRDVEK